MFPLLSMRNEEYTENVNLVSHARIVFVAIASHRRMLVSMLTVGGERTEGAAATLECYDLLCVGVCRRRMVVCGAVFN